MNGLSRIVGGCVVVTQKYLLLAIALFAFPGASIGYDGRLTYPYSVPYRHYGFSHRPDAELELSRMRRELRNQRRFESEQRQRQRQELNLLRQQAFADHRVSAQQACYYRSTGGFELCADLFAKETQDHGACEVLVAQRNPGCNELPLGGVTADETDD